MTTADDKRLQDQVNAANNAGAGACTCPYTDESESMQEWNPDCPVHPALLPQAPDTRSEVETLAEVLGDIRVEQARQEDWWTSDEDHTLLARVLRGECAAWAPGVLAAGYVSPARHDADIAAAKAAGAAEVIARVEAVLDDEALIVASIRRDLERTPSERGGELRHMPGTPGRGRSGCPGDNLTNWLDELRAALTTGGEGCE